MFGKPCSIQAPTSSIRPSYSSTGTICPAETMPCCGCRQRS